MRYILDHPIIAITLAIVGILVGIAGLVRAEYAWGPDAERCGTEDVQTTSYPHQYNECRHPSHGVASYAYSETVTASSGWRGGGYNPIAWCNDVKRSKEQSVGQSIVWATPQHREESKRDFLGHVTYNYHCTIEAKWSPIYTMARSSECGAADPVIVKENKPQSCYDTSKRIGWKWAWQ